MQGSLFSGAAILQNAFVNSQTVEERALEREQQRATLLFVDKVRSAVHHHHYYTSGAGGTPMAQAVAQHSAMH